MLRTVLLELEGVVAETRTARRAALCGALEARGLVLDADTLAAAGDARAVTDAARAALAATGAPHDETDVDLLALDADRRFAAELARGAVSLAPGALDFVHRAQGRARLALVTRARRRDVEQLLALAGLGHAFAFIIAADETVHPKPAPDAYERALRRLGSAPAMAGAVLALEDGHAGIRAARAAGIRCIAVGDLPGGVRLEADGWVPSLAGETADSLAALAERRAGSAA